MFWEERLRKHSDGEREPLTDTQASGLQMCVPARTTHSEVEPLTPPQGLLGGPEKFCSIERDGWTQKYKGSATAAAMQ